MMERGGGRERKRQLVGVRKSQLTGARVERHKRNASARVRGGAHAKREGVAQVGRKPPLVVRVTKGMGSPQSKVHLTSEQPRVVTRGGWRGLTSQLWATLPFQTN